MRGEVETLLNKAIDSVVLSTELFNRPNDRGRTTATLILIDHAFEMFMKAAILHRGGAIRDNQDKSTIGFDACVRRSLSTAGVKYLTDNQATVMRITNGLRDAAQHYILDISERQFYLNVQSAVVLFSELLKDVFGEDITQHLPSRVLPISTAVPTDVIALFETEIEEIKRLLSLDNPRPLDALAKLRPLAIMDSVILGDYEQPSDSTLEHLGNDIVNGTDWRILFEGAQAVRIETDEHGPRINIRITKDDGLPINLVPEGTPGAPVVAVRRVTELGYYNLGAQQLAAHLGLTMPKTVAVVDYLQMRDDPEYYKEISVGKMIHKRYSQKAIDRIKLYLETESIESIWAKTRSQPQR